MTGVYNIFKISNTILFSPHLQPSRGGNKFVSNEAEPYFLRRGTIYLLT